MEILETFRGCFVFQSRVSTKTVVSLWMKAFELEKFLSAELWKLVALNMEQLKLFKVKMFCRSNSQYHIKPNFLWCSTLL